MTGGREDWFPTPIWGFDHPNPSELNRTLLAAIREERDADPSGLAGRSTVLGWHSRDDLHKTPLLAGLAPFIEAGVAEAVRFLKWDLTRVRPTIASCWANINGPGASNVVHVHPLCFLSGVYYVQAEANSGQVFFLDPRPAPVMMLPPVTEHSPWTFNQVRYQPKPGRMLIFPAWLQHGVESNPGPTDRICISFNIGIQWLTT
jgi:uncharacterized protein (TIGR02466 family)